MRKPKRGRLVIDTTYSFYPRALRLLDPEEGKLKLLNRWVKVEGDRVRAGRVSLGEEFTLLPKNLALVLSPQITTYFDLSEAGSSDWLLFYGTSDVGRLHWAGEVYNLGSEPRIEVKTLLEEGQEVDEKGQLKVYETPDWLVNALFSQIKTPLPYVIDLTAGSGEAILKAFDSNPVLKNSKLLGFELRNLKPKDKRNRVIYGANVLNYFRGAAESYSLPGGFYFANPPYTSKRLFERLYINSLPHDSVVVGVYPLGALGILEKRLTGMGVIVPVPDWEGSPERVVVFAGIPRVQKGQPFNIKELPEDATVEEVIRAVEEVGRTADWFAGRLKFPKTPPYRRLKEIYEKGERLNREDYEVIKKRSEEVFSLFSPVQKAISGEEIFPDQRIFGSPRRLSLFQVVGDAVYLSFIKEVDPSTYRFVLSAAKEVGLPVREEKGEKEYATTPNLGLVRFRYYPKVIPINDGVISVVEELLKELNGDLSVIPVLKGLKGKGKIVVKSVMGGDSSRGMSLIGYTPTLAVVNEDGLEHSAIFLPLADFYRRLEEKGVIDISGRVEVIEENRQEKEAIIRGFLRLVDGVKRVEGIEEVPREEVEEFFGMGRDKLVYAVKKATERNLSYPSLIKDPDIEKAAFREVRDYLKSIGYDGNLNLTYIKRFAKAVEDKLYSALFTYKERTLEKLVQAVKRDNPGIDDALAHELAKRTLDGAVSEFVFKDVKRKGLARIMATIYYAERIRELLEKGEVDRAYGELKYGLFGDIYGLRPHQIEESFRLVAKWLRTKEGGHILGWEMRAGKTLAMLNTALLTYAVSGKEVIFSPKTANLNDILLQMSERLPLLTYFAEAYESGDTSPILNGDRKKTLPFREVFPNPFAVARGRLARVFTKAGKTAEEELQTYALTMEKLIEEAEKLQDPLSRIDENSPFAFIKELDGYTEAVRLAFYWYMDAMARQGKIITGGGLFEEFKEKLKAKSDEIKRLIKEDFEEKRSFPVKVIPKPLSLSFNYEVELQESFKVAGVKITLLKDIKVEEVSLKRSTPPPEYAVNSLREGGRVILPEGFLLYAPGDYEEFFVSNSVDIGGLRVDGYRLRAFEEVLREKEEEVGEVDREALRQRYEEALKVVEELSVKDGKRLFEIIQGGELPYWIEKEGEEAIIPVVVSGFQVKDKGVVFLKEVKNPDNPALKEFVPAGVKAVLKLTGKRKVKIKEIIVNDPDAPPLKKASTSNAKHYFVRKKELEGLGAVIVDEVDESINPDNSLTYRSYHYACSHADVKVGGTGTPTSGYPEDLVALSGLVSGMPIETIRATTGIVKDFYSAWEFSNSLKGDVGSFYYDILVNSSPEDFKALVSLVLRHYDNPKRAGEVFLEFVRDRSSDPLIYSKVEDIFSSNEKENIKRIGEVAVKLAEALCDKIEGFNTVPALTSVFLEVGTRFGVISRTPGTLDPVGLVSVLRGASFSFNTREQLKSIAAGKEIKEVLEFDTANLDDTAKKISSLPEEFAPDSGAVRYLVDIELPKNYSEQNLYDLYKNIQLFASYLQKAVEENPEPLCELLGLEERDLMLLVSKRGKTASDDLKTMITRAAVYGVDSLDADEEKKAFVRTVMDRAPEIEELYGISQIAAEEYEKRNPDASKEEVLSVKEAVSDGARGCRYVLAAPLHEEIVLFREVWREAVRPDFEGFTLLYSPVASDTAVIDAFSNAGYFEELSRLAETGESFLLTSPRVESLKTALLDAVSSIARAKREGRGAEETVILVRLTQASIKEAIESLDLERLEKLGITVKTFETPSGLDAESKRYKKPLLLQKELEKEGELERKKLQLVVVSTDTAIARGVDLSHLDEIVSYGITPSGKTATQLYARLFNATDKNEGRVYLIGKPYKYLNVFGESRVYPSSIFYGGAKLLKKVEFVRATLSGEAVNLTAKSQLGKVIPGSAKQEIESRLALAKETDKGEEVEL